MSNQPANSTAPDASLSPVSRVLLRLLRGLRSGWVILGVTLLMLLGVEVLCGRVLAMLDTHQKEERERERRWIQDPDFGAQEWGSRYWKESKAADEARWEPYVYWRRNAFRGEFINIDERGIRKTVNGSTAARPLPIGVFGGSTLWGSGARDAHTIPSELAAMFTREGIPVEITNFGESGYVHTQEMFLLFRALQGGYRPRLVIFYDGINDVYSAYQSGLAGIPQNEEHRRQEFGLLRPKMGITIRRKLADSAVMRLIVYLKSGGEAKPRGGVPGARNLPQLAAQVLQNYKANIQMIDAMGRQYGFETAYFWQPVLFSKRRPSPFETKLLQEHAKLKDLYETAYTHITASDLAAHGCFANLADTFATIDKSVFSDFCHVSELGNKTVAAAIYANLKKWRVLR